MFATILFFVFAAILVCAALGVILALVAVLVAGSFMLRRYRSRRLANLPPDQRGEQSVI